VRQPPRQSKRDRPRTPPNVGPAQRTRERPHGHRRPPRPASPRLTPPSSSTHSPTSPVLSSA
jgi:hypothetical protein